MNLDMLIACSMSKATRTNSIQQPDIYNWTLDLELFYVASEHDFLKLLSGFIKK